MSDNIMYVLVCGIIVTGCVGCDYNNKSYKIEKSKLEVERIKALK